MAPIMPTTDIPRTVRHYRAMGFKAEIMGDFVMTSRDDIELFFSLNPYHDPKRTAACIYVRVNDADGLHAELKAAGVSGLHDPRDTDYKMREFASGDPDNNLILFGSRLELKTSSAPDQMRNKTAR
ncbi:MAG TPA: VOC family protein [Rhizomicrobium sp.]